MDLTPSGREDALYVGGHAWSSRQLFWHRSHVTKAPDGARILAKSAGVPCAAWTIGMRTYGIQYHPEVHEATIERWVRETPEVMDDAGETADSLMSATREFFPAARRLGDRLFERIALLLMPVDRRFAGIAKDLHH
jgi:GMP synthase (glutamine-hydrolysing)